MISKSVRWKQRFENLDKSYLRFHEVVGVYSQTTDKEKQDLISMALAHTFEFTLELSWKTMRDLLNSNAVDVSLSKDVVRAAFSFKLISDGQLWLDMIEDRNMLSHCYDENLTKRIIGSIVDRYYPAITNLVSHLKGRLNEE